MAKKDESAPKKASQPDLPLQPEPDPAPGPAPEQAPEPALDKMPDPDWYVGEEPPPPQDEAPLTVADFHNIAQKQILNATFAVLAETKMDWAMVSPFLDAARDVLLGDIEETAQVRLHTVQQGEDGSWVEADEAYLGISVSDREEGEEWLSDTWWLSEIATADNDPQEVRAIVRALERSIAKLNAWLETRGGPVPPAPAA